MTKSQWPFHNWCHATIACATVVTLSACASDPVPELPRWRLVEEWRVGGEGQGPHSFDFNLGLGKLPNGGFVHFDYKSNELHYLDVRGQPLRTVGRKGGGPGEFMMVNGLVVANDGRVIVSDLANGFSIFGDTGAFIKVVKPTAGRVGLGKLWDVFIFSDGQLVENVEQAAGQSGGESLRVIWSSDLLHADTLPRLSCANEATGPSTRFALKDSTGKVLANIPLARAEPDKAIAFDIDGAIWEQRDPARAEIVRHGLRECDVTRTIMLPGKRASFDSSAKANMMEMATAEAKRWRAMAPEVGALPDAGSWYQSIHLDAAKNLWIDRIDPGGFRIEVYSAEGKGLAQIVAASLPALPMITATHIYGLVSDSDGVRYLVAYRIEKSG